MSHKLCTLIRRRRGMSILLAIFGVLVIVVLYTGLDNIPGIILGYLAAAVLVATLTYTWRSIKRFLILMGAAVAALFLLSFLHEEVVYPLAIMVGGVGASQSYPLEIYHLVTSIIMTFVCPVGLMAGVVGIGALGTKRLLAARSKAGADNNT